jgi:hypothetical protein
MRGLKVNDTPILSGMQVYQISYGRTRRSRERLLQRLAGLRLKDRINEDIDSECEFKLVKTYYVVARLYLFSSS